jgi:hypothetical protein
MLEVEDWGICLDYVTCFFGCALDIDISHSTSIYILLSRVSDLIAAELELVFVFSLDQIKCRIEGRRICIEGSMRNRIFVTL